MIRTYFTTIRSILPFLYSILAVTPLLLLDKGTVFSFLNRLHHGFLDRFFEYMTYLGDATYALGLLLFFLYKKPLKWAFSFTLGFAFHALFVHLFKQWLAHGMLRPYGYYSEISQLAQFHWIDGVSMKMLNSFPSGHTTTAFFFASFIACYLGHRVMTYALLVLALLAGISRVYLGQHWFVDVYAGALFGLSSTALALWIIWVFPRKWHAKQWL